MHIQWYPGHMTKAKRMMEESIKLIDVVIELVDARVPMSGRNPEIDNIIGPHKKRCIILNKSDLADNQMTEKWLKYYEKENIAARAINSLNNKDVKQVPIFLREICRDVIERNKKRGFLNKPLRVMVTGIPNVGKSTLINSLIGRASAKTGNRPGVTKGKQWLKLKKDIELLDTPGILWPKFEDQMVARKLAFIGSIKDEILDNYALLIDLLIFLKDIYPEKIKEIIPEINDYDKIDDLIVAQSKKSKMLLAGDLVDVDRYARRFLDDFRNGRKGTYTLDIL